MRIAQLLIIFYLGSSLSLCSEKTLLPMNTGTKQIAALATAGSIIAAAGAYGVSKKSSRIKALHTLSPKVVRMLSFLALAGGSSLSIAAAAFLVRNKQLARQKIPQTKETEAPKTKEPSTLDTHKMASLETEEVDSTLSPDEEDLGEKKIRLMELIKKTSGSKYILHRTGLISDSPEKDLYLMHIPKTQNAPLIRHYAEYYYKDPTHAIIIFKVVLYSSTQATPEITFFIVLEDPLASLSTIIESPLSFLRQVQNSSRFNQIAGSELMPQEIFISNAFYASYKNGALAFIEPLQKPEWGSKHEPDLDQAEQAAQGSTKDSSHSLSNQIAPWDLESSTSEESYFRKTLVQLREIAREKENYFLNCIREIPDDHYDTITKLKPIPPELLAKSSSILTDYIESPEEYSYILKNCTHYIEHFAQEGEYCFLKTLLCDSKGIPHKTIINIIHNTSSNLLHNHYDQRTRTLFHMFIEYRNAGEYQDVFSATQYKNHPFSVSSLQIYNNELHESISFQFNGAPNSKEIRVAHMFKTSDRQIFTKTIRRKGNSFTPEANPEYIIDAVIQTQNDAHAYYKTRIEVYRYNDKDCTQPNTVEIILPPSLKYTSILHQKTRLWTHTITRISGDKHTCSWSSQLAFQKSSPSHIVAKIIDGITQSRDVISPTPVAIASKILNYMPRALPSLPLGAGFVSKIALNDLSAMYTSFQNIYAAIHTQENTARLQAQNILDSYLTENEQVSLLLNAPYISSLIAQESAKISLNPLYNEVLITLIKSLENCGINSKLSTHHYSQQALTFYERHAHRLAIPKMTSSKPQTLLESIMEAFEKISTFWQRIPTKQRTSFVSGIHAFCSNPHALYLAQKYIPLPEYFALQELPSHEASELETILLKFINTCRPEVQKILKPYLEVLQKVATNKPVEYSKIPYNLLLEIIHSYVSATTEKFPSILNMLRKSPHSLNDYTTQELPAVAKIEPSIHTCITTAISILMVHPIQIAFFMYRQLLKKSTISHDTELLELITSLFKHVIESLQKKSFKEMLSSISDTSTHLNQVVEKHTKHFTDVLAIDESASNSSLQQADIIKKKIYCLFIEKIYDALKPKDTSSPLHTFLRCRKESIIKVIKENSLTAYCSNIIKTFIIYLETQAKSSINNRLTLCTLQPAGFIMGQFIKSQIPLITQKIPEKKDKTCMKEVFESMIPLYNACIPLINYCIKQIEKVANTLPIKALEELIQITQDILWYFS